MLTHVDSLFFDDLRSTVRMGLIWSESSTIAVTSVASFFEKRLGSIRSFVLLFNDEVRRTTQVGISGFLLLHVGRLVLHVFCQQLVRVLADVVKEFTALHVLLDPSGHVVVRLLLL